MVKTGNANVERKYKTKGIKKRWQWVERAISSLQSVLLFAFHRQASREEKNKAADTKKKKKRPDISPCIDRTGESISGSGANVEGAVWACRTVMVGTGARPRVPGASPPSPDIRNHEEDDVPDEDADEDDEDDEVVPDRASIAPSPDCGCCCCLCSGPSSFSSSATAPVALSVPVRETEEEDSLAEPYRASCARGDTNCTGAVPTISADRFDDATEAASSAHPTDRGPGKLPTLLPQDFPRLTRKAKHLQHYHRCWFHHAKRDPHNQPIRQSALSEPKPCSASLSWRHCHQSFHWHCCHCCIYCCYCCCIRVGAVGGARQPSVQRGSFPRKASRRSGNFRELKNNEWDLRDSTAFRVNAGRRGAGPEDEDSAGQTCSAESRVHLPRDGESVVPRSAVVVGGASPLNEEEVETGGDRSLESLPGPAPAPGLFPLPAGPGSKTLPDEDDEGAEGDRDEVEVGLGRGLEPEFPVDEAEDAAVEGVFAAVEEPTGGESGEPPLPRSSDVEVDCSGGGVDVVKEMGSSEGDEAVGTAVTTMGLRDGVSTSEDGDAVLSSLVVAVFEASVGKRAEAGSAFPFVALEPTKPGADWVGVEGDALMPRSEVEVEASGEEGAGEEFESGGEEGVAASTEGGEGTGANDAEEDDGGGGGDGDGDDDGADEGGGEDVVVDSRAGGGEGGGSPDADVDADADADDADADAGDGDGGGDDIVGGNQSKCRRVNGGGCGRRTTEDFWAVW
ncbi:hypothetical protein DFJ73DRAFT_939517 [Zopfochytrium polystomum]|nr:hypothetical protein DFJ73DRAFT_939517 [Zopfochytrium polystomum]